MAKHIFLLVVSTSLASSCAASSTPVEIAAEQRAISAECADDLAISRLRASSLESVGLVDVAQQDLTLAFGFEAIGSCASRISNFERSNIVIDDTAKSLLVSGADGYSLQPQKRGFDKTRYLYSVGFSPEASGTFVLAAPVVTTKSEGMSKVDYVGLWRSHDRTGYEVRGFSLIDGKLSGSPRSILSTERTVRSISYTPSPDAPMGTIDLVLDGGSEKVEIVGVRWMHGDFYRPDPR